MSRENLQKEHAEETEEEKEEVSPGWIKISAHSFKRIRKRVNNAVKNGWHSKVDNKSVTMNTVKIFLQDIVSGKFNNAEEAKKMYSNNVYTDEQKIRKSDKIPDRKRDMIEVYDQVSKNFLTPRLIPDMDYVPIYNKSDTTDMSDSETEEETAQRRQGLKILSPDQMLSRLNISLAQLKAGKNSRKLENEIRCIDQKKTKQDNL